MLPTILPCRPENESLCRDCRVHRRSPTCRRFPLRVDPPHDRLRHVLAALRVDHECVGRGPNGEGRVAVLGVAPEGDIEKLPASLGQDLEGGLRSVTFGHLKVNLKMMLTLSSEAGKAN